MNPAERAFYADVLARGWETGEQWVQAFRHPEGGRASILAHWSTRWVEYGAEELRAALPVLAQMRASGEWVPVDHECTDLRVLCDRLAAGQPAGPYDDCVVRGLLRLVVLGDPHLPAPRPIVPKKLEY
jgi:hypothetical protein